MKSDTIQPAAASSMQWLSPWLPALLIACAMSCVAAPAQAGELWTLAETRPLHGPGTAAAPWPVGTPWMLLPASLVGPPPLLCQQARQRLLLMPTAGLFQGAWQIERAEAAAARAAALGLQDRTVATLRLDCANASFDFHRNAAGQLLTAFDGQVLVLRVDATAGDAQTTVRQLLLQHLDGPEVFGPPSIAALRRWLAPPLQQAFTRWLASPERPDQVPALNGDPFTDTQEPPHALSLGPLAERGDGAEQVVFAELEGGRRHRLVYRLQRDAQSRRWLLADIAYSHGPTLRQLLREDSH
ncbi:MAG: hypothetical protein IV097_17645 [Burkholderiaceae bacterium]|nr:hypothetical protein [Burkholderiaceae bacterium]